MPQVNLWRKGDRGEGRFRNWPHGRTHNKNKKAHRVPEYAVARQQVPDDAADDGATVNADEHVQPAQLEGDGHLRCDLGSQNKVKVNEGIKTTF